MVIYSSILARRIPWTEGYSPCGRKELNMTEAIYMHLSPDLRKMQTHTKVYKPFQGVQEFPKVLVL